MQIEIIIQIPDLELAANIYNNKNGSQVDSRDEDYSAMLVMNLTSIMVEKTKLKKLKEAYKI